MTRPDAFTESAPLALPAGLTKADIFYFSDELDILEVRHAHPADGYITQRDAEPMMRNDKHSWGAIARMLHWSMAVLILGQIALGFIAHEMPRSPLKLDLMVWHKSIGVCLLLMILFRFMWRLANQPPSALEQPRWEKIVSRLAHWSLYGLMCLVPLTGWLMNSAKNIPLKIFWLFPLPSIMGPDREIGNRLEEWHELAAWTLLVLAALHAAVALWHHFVRKDDVLNRMLGKQDV